MKRKKLASTLPNMVLSLGVITVAAGGLLGAMYSVTKEPIARQALEQQTAAIRDVAPEFNNDPESDKWECEESGQTFTVYPAMLDGRLNGAAVKGATMSGFAGEIVVMCGFEADGTVKDYRVLQMAETPGLGSKMESWFRDPAGARSVIGKNPATTEFRVTKDAGGEIDGITAATISSRAFLTVMRDAFDAYCKYAADKGVEINRGKNADASTGASGRHEEKAEETVGERHHKDASTGASGRHEEKAEETVGDRHHKDASTGASGRHEEKAEETVGDHHHGDAASGASVRKDSMEHEKSNGGFKGKFQRKSDRRGRKS